MILYWFSKTPYWFLIVCKQRFVAVCGLFWVWGFLFFFKHLTAVTQIIQLWYSDCIKFFVTYIFMDIVVYSLYYNSFPKICETSPCLQYCNLSQYLIVYCNPVSWYVPYRQIPANTQPLQISQLIENDFTWSIYRSIHFSLTKCTGTSFNANICWISWSSVSSRNIFRFWMHVKLRFKPGH